MKAEVAFATANSRKLRNITKYCVSQEILPVTSVNIKIWAPIIKIKFKIKILPFSTPAFPLWNIIYDRNITSSWKKKYLPSWQRHYCYYRAKQLTLVIAIFSQVFTTCCRSLPHKLPSYKLHIDWWNSIWFHYFVWQGFSDTLESASLFLTPSSLHIHGTVAPLTIAVQEAYICTVNHMEIWITARH